MLLVEVVRAGTAVGAVPSRTAKVAILAELLGRVPADELETVVAALTGEPRQGKAGVGWATMTAVAETTPSAATPTLTVTDLDDAVSGLQSVAGAGSVAFRSRLLSDLLGRASDRAGGFVMLGKTFKGLTDDLLRWQTARLLELETARNGIVVHVRPELVVEVALDGVQASTRYPGGVALRFARVRRYRPDKAPADADVIEDVRAMLPLHGS